MLLSIGDQVKPGTYRLHSRFSRAVNFEHAGRLVSVVDETIGPGPLNIVLRDLNLAPAPPHAGPASPILKGLNNPAQVWIARARGRDPTLGKHPSKVPHPERVEYRIWFDTPTPLKISNHMVLFAGHSYRFTPRHRYDSTLELRAVDPRRYRRNLSILGDALRADAPSKSLAFLLDDKRQRNVRTGFEQTYAERITRGVSQVFQGRLLEGIRQLKGCGLGLTPGGDDFLAGLLIGLHVLQRLRGQVLQRTIDTIAHAARGNNIFSNTFLDLARRGLLLGRIKDLVLALSSSRPGYVRKAAEALFAIGETSGADLATGLFMTLHSGIDSIN
jgi:hypothetical protein